MTDVMKGILSRVLSQEIAHQEIWKQKEHEKFGDDKVNRDAIIEEIRSFMAENKIPFRDDFYIQEF